MENKRKLGLLSLILGAALLTACGSNPSTEGGDAGEEASSDSSNQTNSGGASAQGIGEDAKITGGSVVNEAEIAAEMLTVYYFDFNQAGLSADTRKALDVVAKALKSSGVSNLFQ